MFVSTRSFDSACAHLPWQDLTFFSPEFQVLIGPIGDWTGMRIAYAVLLVLGSNPGFLLAASQSYAAIVVFRFLVGFAGASFVLTQLWTTTMFDLNVVGIANATSAGWGNLGGGVSQLLNTAIFVACKNSGFKNDLAWRTTLAWSPAVLFCLGVGVFLFTDDCPYGRFKELKARQSEKDKEEANEAALKAGGEAGSVASKSLIEAACNWQTWVLHLCYMFSFGVELIVNGNIVSYFVETFGMTQSDAGMIGSIFGFLNIFARSFGGWHSDVYNAKWGPRGRLHALFQQTFIMGICLICFSSLTKDKTTQAAMIVNLVCWGIFTNMTEGGTFAVVPYVLPSAVGGVAGITGAGGNTGAMLGNGLMVVLKERSKASRMLAFCALGWAGLASAMLVPCLWIGGVGSMFRGVNNTPPAASKEQEKVDPVAPAQVAGPQPTFVPISSHQMEGLA